MALELSMPLPDPLAKSACIDVLNAVVEFSPTIVREYCLQQASDVDDVRELFLTLYFFIVFDNGVWVFYFMMQDTLLLNVIIEQLISDRDPELGGAVQLSGVLRLLIDPENMLAALNKSEKADFLNLFYKQSMSLLIGMMYRVKFNFRLYLM